MRGSLLHEVWKASNENDITLRAASLALFSVMSVFPFIAILVWATTLSGSPHEAHILAERFALFLPPDIGELLSEEVSYRLERSTIQNNLSLFFHLSLLMFSAGSALRSFLFSLREIAMAEDVIGISAIFWRSILFVIPVIIFVFIASLLVGFVIFISHSLSDILQSTWLAKPLIWLIMSGILVLILNAVYASSLIGHQIIRIHGWIGSATAAALVSIVTILLTSYYEVNPVNRDFYGSPGLMLNILLWFYICSNCILLGAQVNAVLDSRKR